MAEKIALMGFDRLSLFPLLKNTSTEYSVGEKLSLPNVQSMTKDVDSAESKIYADDSLYLNIVNFNGLNVELTVAEMPLELWAELGFGEYDEDEKVFNWNPQGKNQEYAMTFRALQANGEYRMYRMYRFTVNTIAESEQTTKGDTADVQPYVISGTLSTRAFDSKFGAVHDGTDFDWLDEVPEMPEQGL